MSSSNQVVVYDDAQFQGFAQALDPGQYDWGQIHNDTISSLTVPAGMRVTLYSDTRFSGQSKTFTTDAPYVGDDFNDQTSSIVIEVGGSPTGTPNAQADEMLAAQNRYRAEVGVPPLQWSDSLAASAQQWADHLAQTGAFEHSGAAENLAQGTSGFFSATQLVDMWGGEKQYFSNGIFPNVSTSGNWSDVGHYTQMVWRNTTEVGCGLASGNGNDVLVCHYNPSGNVEGQGVF